MTGKRAKIGIAVICAAGLAAALALMPVLIMETEQGYRQWVFGGAGKKFSLSFIHSVHLTPVTEHFVITNRKTFKLQSVEYQSFGVGLPFLRGDGVFCFEGGRFVMKDMDREFQTIELMVYPDNKLTFTSGGQVDCLYQKLPYASLFRLRAGTLGGYWAGEYFDLCGG